MLVRVTCYFNKRVNNAYWSVEFFYTDSLCEPDELDLSAEGVGDGGDGDGESEELVAVTSSEFRLSRRELLDGVCD
jgi:hypothetical protein